MAKSITEKLFSIILLTMLFLSLYGCFYVVEENCSFTTATAASAIYSLQSAISELKSASPATGKAWSWMHAY